MREILRANILTRFNALLGALLGARLVVILVVGPVQDALFGIMVVANSAVGIPQELRAKHSKIRDALNRLLQVITWFLVPIATLLVTTQLLVHDAALDKAVRGSVAGVVGMVPKGLVLLTSVAFAVGVVRLAHKDVLVQELPAIEGLARRDEPGEHLRDELWERD